MKSSQPEIKLAREYKISTRKTFDALVRLAGLFDPAVRGQLFEFGKVRRASSVERKAERELERRRRPLDETLVDTAASLRTFAAT